MTFFNDCKSIEEVKARYKQLAKQYHPDMGGDTETMQAINREYAFASARITKGAGLNADETEEQIRFSEDYRRVIEAIIHLPGILIELVGAWVWVTGNTYAVKTQLRAAGLFFASKKQAWYYRAEAYKSRGTNKTLAEIRGKYGSERINAKRFKREINN